LNYYAMPRPYHDFFRLTLISVHFGPKCTHIQICIHTPTLHSNINSEKAETSNKLMQKKNEITITDNLDTHVCKQY